MQPIYATLPDRVKAAVIDGFLLIVAMYAISEILSSFDNVPNYVRIILAIIVFLLYDPFFTSFYGGTIGHSYSNIEVKKLSNHRDKISFPIAIVRFLAKAGLGWLSLLTVAGNEKKMAIHDHLAQSVLLSNEGEQ
jgi:uncharacterized RDD family membrane protein YckC